MDRNPTRLIAHVSIAFTGLIVLVLLYWPGTFGALYYDDYGNLEKLSNVVDWASAKAWALDGFAGPLGRPLALFSFVPHASHWPDNAQTILAVNVLIHALNAICIAILSYLLLRSVSALRGTPLFAAALLTAALWATMPLIASTSLIAIQRMTGLAALFGLLGLTGFVWAQQSLASRPAIAFFASMALLGLGTGLGMLSKENAALVPIFALLLSIFFLPGIRQIGGWAILRNGILALALLSILVYLSPLNRDWFAVIDHRGWSPWERLQTQSIILWDYVRLALLPRPNAFSPFHDHVQSSAYSWQVYAASTGWVLLLILALWMYLRRANHWPLFALLWFFTAHLLESTIIGLELQFEHRNYLAFYGVFLAAVAGAFHSLPDQRRLWITLVAAFLLVQSAVLLGVTTLWGEPSLAAEVWYQENPASSRALGHIAVQDGVEDGGDEFDANAVLLDLQRRALRLERTDKTLSHCPECLGTHLQGIILSCSLEKPEQRKNRLDAAIQAARSGKARTPNLRVTIESLFNLRDHVLEDACPPLTAGDLRPFARALAEHGYFRAKHLRGRVLFLNAALAEDDGDLEARDAWLRRGERVAPIAVPILQYQVYSALDENRPRDALLAIERRRDLHRKGIEMTDEVLDELEAEVRAETREGTE